MFRQKWALLFTLCYEINDPLVQPWTVQGRSSNATPFVIHPRSTKEGDCDMPYIIYGISSLTSTVYHKP